jgi:hypothetical protein
MATRIIAVADALVDELNSITWSQTFTAERVYLPDKNAQDWKNLTVLVTLGATAQDLEFRGRRKWDHVIGVGFIKLLEDNANIPALDSLAEVVEEVAAYYGGLAGGGKRIIADTNAAVFGVANAPIYSPDDLAKNMFLGYLTLDVSEIEAL